MLDTQEHCAGDALVVDVSGPSARLGSSDAWLVIVGRDDREIRGVEDLDAVEAATRWVSQTIRSNSRSFRSRPAGVELKHPTS